MCTTLTFADVCTEDCDEDHQGTNSRHLFDWNGSVAQPVAPQDAKIKTFSRWIEARLVLTIETMETSGIMAAGRCPNSSIFPRARAVAWT